MGSVGPAGQKGVPADARAVSDGCSGLRYAAGLLAGGIPTEFGFPPASQRRWCHQRRTMPNHGMQRSRRSGRNHVENHRRRPADA